MAGCKINEEFEYFLVVKAKDGDKAAFAALWNHYKKQITSMLKYCKWLSYEERASEAALLFAHKLEIFDPSKVNKSPEDWTFSYMLTGGMKNLRRRLMNCFRNDMKFGNTFFEYDPTDIVDDQISSDQPLTREIKNDTINTNTYDYYEKSNPEFLVLKTIGKSLQTREHTLDSRLSIFQKAILELRRQGVTLKVIADSMGCSDAKIRRHIKMAKEAASIIFGIDYLKV